MPRATGSRTVSSGQDIRQMERRSRVLATLGRRLSGATTVKRAAEIMMEAADDLLGWDSCSVDLYSPELDTTSCILALDIINGKRREVRHQEPDSPPTPRLRQVICDGARILLRDGASPREPDAVLYGDTGRPSASLLFVPIRSEKRVVGVLSIQSYTPFAYTEESLNLLQALGDHLGGAIERIQVTGLLRRTEELYRRAIGGAGAVPYAYDYRTRSYAFMGDGIEELTGYSPKEISGDVWAQIIKESAMAGDAAGLEKTEAARRVTIGQLRNWRCDMRIVTRDGKSRWISDASVQNLDECGRAIGSMGILEDITERKQAELSALALSKLGQGLISATTAQEVARTLSTVADGLFNWDGCTFFLYFPERDEVQPVLYIDTIGGQRQDVPPPAFVSGPGVVDRRVIEHGPELTLREADGLALNPEAIPFGDTSRPSASIMRVPVRLRTRQVTGIISLQSYTFQAYTRRDLNTLQTLADCCGVALERIWADDALRQSESQFRLVWETSADGMRLTNREGVILRVNDAYCRLVQRSRAELEGQVLSVVHVAADADYALRRNRERIDTDQPDSHAEKEITLWNGRKVWFETSHSVLTAPGTPALLLSIIHDITQRKAAEAQLERMHGQLLEVSREAGMAEVATSVLHNVGNVLNSVNISSSLVSGKVKNSKVANLARAVALMQAHTADLGAFLTQDPKGKQLPGYLSSLSEHLAAERAEILAELQALSSNVEHINEIVAMQQSYARVIGVLESLSVVELVEDALRLNAGAMERHKVQIAREFSEVPPILVDKHKVLQILINLIRNAKYALDDRGHDDRHLTVRIQKTQHQSVAVSVIDNGIGIPAENLTRIFEHGFTTRKKGHGFGLHNGALAARELGGSLTAHSDGPGTGAMFTLELPIERKKATA